MMGLRPSSEPNHFFYRDYNPLKARFKWLHTLVDIALFPWSPATDCPLNSWDHCVQQGSHQGIKQKKVELSPHLFYINEAQKVRYRLCHILWVVHTAVLQGCHNKGRRFDKSISRHTLVLDVFRNKDAIYGANWNKFALSLVFGQLLSWMITWLLVSW